MSRRSVVFPAPFGPTRPTREFFAIPQSIPVRTSWAPYARTTPLSRIMRPVYTAAGGCGNAASGDENDLPVRARLEDEGVRPRGLRQRHLAADDGAERAVLETDQERRVDRGHLLLAGVPERHPEDRGVAAHRVARIDRDRAAAADDDDPAAGSEYLEIIPEIQVRKHLEDHVHPAPSRDGRDLPEISRGAMVEDVVGALPRREVAPLRRTTGPDHEHPAGAAQLDGREADAAARPVDQEALAGHRAGLVEQGPIRGSVRDRHRRALRERQGPREGVDLVLGAQGELGIGPAQRPGRVDRLARR